jgi:hypothetical protein
MNVEPFNSMLKMKKIEDFDLRNMQLADRYLSGRMSEHEMFEFHRRLEMDVELQDDLDMAKAILGFEASPWWATPRKAEASAQQRRLSKKIAIGKDLVAYGLAALATAAVMGITSALVILLLQ